MADFVAVLRKTIGSLSDNTPEMREKVFDKARATIEARLKAIEPPPPAAVVERQRKALEDAIATIRADYVEPEIPEASEAEDDPLASVFAALDNQPPAQPVQPPVQPMQAQGQQARLEQVAAPETVSFPAAPGVAPVAPTVSPGPEFSPDMDPAADSGIGVAAAAGTGRIKPAATAPRSRGLLASIIVIILLLGAGGGYMWWSNRTDTPVVPIPVAEDSSETQEEAATTAEELTDEQPEAEAEQTQAQQEQEQEQPASGAATVKLTQRLLPDGSEVDDGPAGGEPGIGEGSSVATAVQPERAAPTTAPAAEAQPGPATQDAETATATDEAEEQPAPARSEAQPAAVAVGQRAIFYEERTAAAEGSAEMGTIAWSLVQESPGGDLPPEPAIRAEATIPAKNVQLRMTIRRNGDQTLPASHIVEMIFLTPDDFEGGGVASVSRIAFKETEQAPGSPLIGIPAKIADGFFLIALSDAPAETQANLNLLRRQDWVDIPITYQSGQRALLSLEKGIPGDRVFQEALRAWTDEASN